MLPVPTYFLSVGAGDPNLASHTYLQMFSLIVLSPQTPNFIFATESQAGFS